MRYLSALLIGMVFLGGIGGAEKAAKEEEEALQKNAEAFVAAFNKGDAQAVAGFWSADGDYVQSNGKHLKGRKAIEKAFEKFFADNKGMRIQITITSIRLLKPDLAIEDGTTDLLPPDGGPAGSTRYTLVHVKEDGQWRLASVRSAPFVAPSNHEHLQELEWLIGDWVDAVEEGEVARVSFHWAEDRNFIVSTFATTLKDIPVSGGTQWIGWDPIAKTIRSWSFESHGGFGEGTWSRKGNEWTVKSSAVLREGKKAGSTNLITRVDADHLSWESKDRTLDGKKTPDSPKVKMKRQK